MFIKLAFHPLYPLYPCKFVYGKFLRITAKILVLFFCVGVVCSHGLAGARESGARVVSFSPAITRILFDMGLGEQVVAVTRLCHLPQGQNRPRVGDAFNFNVETVLNAKPDIIFTQSPLGKFKGIVDINPRVKIVQLEIETLDDISAAIERIGMLLERRELAKTRRDLFEQKIEAVRKRSASRAKPRVLFVMGTDRPTAAGANNFIDDLIGVAGGINAGADIPGKTRWRRTGIDAIVKSNPDVLICQTFIKGGADRARKYWLKWKDLPAARSGRVFVVTDPAWSIPATHLADFASDMENMVHSTKVSANNPTLSLSIAQLYRLLAAAVVGAALGVAGMALQGLLRNPLAEPYILGISSGAGVGVLLGLALTAWIAIPQWISTPLLAFTGSLITCAVVYAIAQRRGRLDPYTLILSGVIVNTFNAAIMLTIYLYIDPHRIADFTYWAMGRLGDSVDLTTLGISAACVFVGWAVLLYQGSAFNVLGLGQAVAASSGVRINRLRMVTFLCVGVMTAAAVSLAGPIGFLGLVVPHICRMLIGPDHRWGIIASGIVGAIFLVLAELFCRSLGPWIGVSIIPVGILTALAGGPFFIFLLRRRFAEVSP